MNHLADPDWRSRQSGSTYFSTLFLPIVLSLSVVAGCGSSSDSDDPEPTADTTPPTISLIGANPLTVSLGSSYTDPSATAMDDVDGNISASIVVGGDTVDTGTAYYQK